MSRTDDIYQNNPEGEGWQAVETPPPLPGQGILAGMSEESLANISQYGRYQKYEKGLIIIQEGIHQDRLYILISGTLEVYLEVNGDPLMLSLAEPGECLGEVSLLGPGPASASVRVRETAVCWSMGLEDFRKYLGEHVGGGGALLLGMAQCLSQRIRHANELISRSHLALANPPHAVIPRQERVITTADATVTLSFFDRIKKSLGGTSVDSKPTFSTTIKM